MRAFYISLITAICLIPAVALSAVKIQMSVDNKTVGQDEQLLLTIAINLTTDENIEQIKYPELTEFEITNRSTQYETQIMNAEVSIRQIYQLTLRPKKKGAITIPPAKVKVSGTIYQSNSLTINVTATPSKKSAPPGLLPDDDEPEESVETDSDIYLKGEVSKSSVYLGENTIATYHIYIRARLQVMDFLDFKTPEGPGFTSIDLFKSNRLNFENVRTREGHYKRAIIWKRALFPNKSGKIKLTPLKLTVTKPVGFFRKIKQRLQSQSLTFTVLPLPEQGQPKDFISTNVGQYSISAAVDNNRIEKGKTDIILKIKISGQGNISAVKLGELASNENFEVYSPTMKDSQDIQGERFLGVKTYEYLLSPKKHGNLTLSPIPFSFFNTARQRYETLQTQPIAIFVAKEVALHKEDPQKTESKTTSAVESSGIRGIKYQSKLSDQTGKLFENPIALGLFCLPLLLYVLMSLLYLLKKRALTQANHFRMKKAGKNALSKIKRLKEKVDGEDKNAFFGNLSNVIFEFFENKFNQPVIGITISQLQELLKSKGYLDTVIRELTDELEHYDFARFAPSNCIREEMLRSIDRALKLIQVMDSGKI